MLRQQRFRVGLLFFLPLLGEKTTHQPWCKACLDLCCFPKQESHLKPETAGVVPSAPPLHRHLAELLGLVKVNLARRRSAQGQKKPFLGWEEGAPCSDQGGTRASLIPEKILRGLLCPHRSASLYFAPARRRVLDKFSCPGGKLCLSPATWKFIPTSLWLNAGVVRRHGGWLQLVGTSVRN